tara:strand:- start:4099 stop:5370 length:1272 start_codon:yes stop_codon:yes gene_type:complete
MGAFGRGFITGLANKVSEEIDRDMEATRDNALRKAELRAQRSYAIDEENKKAYKETKQTIEDMVGKVGSEDGVQYLINNFGFAEAQNVANKLYSDSQSLGLKPLDQIGLAQRTGRGITLDELIKHNAPVSTIPKISGDPAVGFAKMFSTPESRMANLRATSDAELEELGIAVADADEAIESIPPALKGSLKPYMLGRLANPKDESVRLRRVSANLLAQGKKEEAAALKTESDALYLISQVGEKKKMTIGEVNATSKLLDGAIAQRFKLKGTLTDEGFLISEEIETSKKEEYLKKSGYVMNVLSDFVVANGIGSYAQGLKTVKEAIAKNKNVVFIPATENMPARIEMDNENVFFNEYTDADTADVANVVAGSGATADETQPSSIITTSDLEQELMKQQPGSAKAEAIIAKLKREIPGYVRPEGF